MSSPEVFIDLLHADPEQLEGVPTNAELVEANDAVLKNFQPEDISPEVRSGFLQMWQKGYVRKVIFDLDAENADQLFNSVKIELLDEELPEKRARDLRFIFHAAQTAKHANTQKVVNVKKELSMSEFKEEPPRNFYRPGGETPYDMPQEIFWDKTEGGAHRRAQWVIYNRPDVEIEELTTKFALHDVDLRLIDLTPSRQGE